MPVGLGVGLFHSNVVAKDDRDICPGKVEEWEEVLGKVSHLTLHMAHGWVWVDSTVIGCTSRL